MNSIRKILDKILEVACILIFGIMTILVVYQVVTRYVFQSPSSWSESVVTYGLSGWQCLVVLMFLEKEIIWQ